MMRFIKNLFERFIDDGDEDFNLRPTTSAPRVRPRPAPHKPASQPLIHEDSVEDEIYTADIGGRIDDGGPGKNVLIRSKYVREDTGTHETLKIVDDSIFINDEELGIDPYNTGRFDRSKTWDASRFRK